MRKRSQRILSVVAAASLSLAIGVGSAGAVKPEGTPGGGNDKPKKPNAAKLCKAERADIGVDAFREKYGSNKNGKNAFGKCVSSQKKHADDDGGDTVTS